MLTETVRRCVNPLDLDTDTEEMQEYSTESLLRLSAPQAEILLAGNLIGELKSWIEIYPRRFSCCDFCLNVVEIS